MATAALINTVYHLGHRFVGQSHDGAYGSNLHLLVDGTCIHVEGTTEDVGEYNDVVDLVRIVATARTHQHIRACRHRIFVRDFGSRVGKGEDDGLIGHRTHHILVDKVACRKAEEDIGTHHSLAEVVDVATRSGKLHLCRTEISTVVGEHTILVNHNDVLLACAELVVHLDATHGSSAGTRNDDAHVLNLLAIDLQGIDETCTRNDGSAMLVVVHHGDVAVLFQTFFDIEALGRLDVLKVDSTKRGSNTLYGLAELHRVGLIDFDVEDVDATIDLEEQSLTLHNGFSCQGTDVAQSEHSRAIGNNGYKVAAIGVTERVIGVLLDFETWKGNARRISQRKVCLCTIRLGWYYGNFTGPTRFMIA